MGCCQSDSQVKLENDIQKPVGSPMENVFLKELSKASEKALRAGSVHSANHKTNDVGTNNPADKYRDNNATLRVEHAKELQRKISSGLSVVNIGPEIFVTMKKGAIKDSYTIGRLLGEGAYGKVYLVYQKTTNLKRAMKSIKKNFVGDKAKKLLTEVHILKTLDHPHIVRLLELFQDDSNYYLITEFCSGGELFDQIQKLKSFSEKKAAEYMKQILSAILYLHERHIIHRDIKPENLLLENESPDAILKIIDFGLSIPSLPGEKQTEKVGTPYYVAPEVLNKCYDEKCDVWSCGVLLYILLCGYPPFRGSNDKIILERVKKGTFVFEDECWDHISKEAKDLIKKMLTYDPAKRLSAAEALNDSWIQQATSKKQDMPFMNKFLDNLSKFNARNKLKQAIMTLIASTMISTHEREEMRKIFKSLDVDGNGSLTKDELIQGYKAIFPEMEQAEAEVNKILAAADTNNSGKIDFTEFIVAAMQRDKLLSKVRIEQAFKQFDADGDGFITKDELVNAMGGLELNDEMWNSLIRDADTNKDGKISEAEFVNLLIGAYYNN